MRKWFNSNASTMPTMTNRFHNVKLNMEYISASE